MGDLKPEGLGSNHRHRPSSYWRGHFARRLLALALFWVLLFHFKAHLGLRQHGRRSAALRDTNLHLVQACLLDACVSVEPPATHDAPSAIRYGMRLDDINHSIEGGLHVEVLRDWSFEARAYLPDLMKAGAQKGEASAGLKPGDEDLQAWEVSNANVSMEVVGTNLAGHQLHALCLGRRIRLHAQLVNTGHSLHGSRIVKGDQLRVRLRVKGDADALLLLITDPAGMQILALSEVLRAQGSSQAWNTTHWSTVERTLTSKGSHLEARFVVRVRYPSGPGHICFDWVSVTPEDSWRADGTLDPLHPGLVKGLKQEVRPQFLMLPVGSALTRWRDTVGPREERAGQLSPLGFWSPNGVGLFELMSLAEAVGAKPIWVVAAPSSLDAVQAWQLEALESLEFLMGVPHSRWGQVRAAMGRRQPWALDTLVMGQELQDCSKPLFAEAMQGLSHAIRARWPGAQLHAGCPHEHHLGAGKAAGRRAVTALAEHGEAHKVALHQVSLPSQNDTVLSAIREAAQLAHLESHCGQARMVLASHAPVLGHARLRTWGHPLLVFDDRGEWYRTPALAVVREFRQHAGARCAQASVRGTEAGQVVTSASCMDASCGQLAVKLVNQADQQLKVLLHVHPTHTFMDWVWPSHQWSRVVAVRQLWVKDPAHTSHKFDGPEQLLPRNSFTQLDELGGAYLSLPPSSLTIALFTEGELDAG